MYPTDIRSPTFLWEDTHPGSEQWLIEVAFNDSDKDIFYLTDQTSWTPAQAVWERIKKLSLGARADVTAWGIGGSSKTKILSTGEVSIMISPNPVGAPIVYRELAPPAWIALEHTYRIRMRIADLSSYHPPRIILENKKVRYNCHTTSLDGETLGFVIQPTFIAPTTNIHQRTQLYSFSKLEDKKFTIDSTNTFLWDASVDEKTKDRISPSTPSYSVFQFHSMGPGGEFAVSAAGVWGKRHTSSKTRYSFTTSLSGGLLGVFSRKSRTYRLLPGADDDRYIHTTPAWSPDGKYIAFSRVTKRADQAQTLEKLNLHPKYVGDRDLEFFRKLGGEQYQDKFNIYRVPFNDGKGGKAIPLVNGEGGESNKYFPKYSPNGKWIVYTASRRGALFIQPDSELFIIPAEGGSPRRLHCNFTGAMNSWHSWSPNSKWLIFSSKVNSEFTEMFLTHIDESGMDSPPIWLSNMTEAKSAANLPEFINIDPKNLHAIVLPQDILSHSPARAKRCLKCHEAHGRTPEGKLRFDFVNEDEESAEREALMRFINKISAATAERPWLASLIARLAHDHRAERVMAAESLGHIGDRRAIEALTHCLKDSGSGMLGG